MRHVVTGQTTTQAWRRSLRRRIFSFFCWDACVPAVAEAVHDLDDSGWAVPSGFAELSPR